jgi:G3E family GTPase
MDKTTSLSSQIDVVLITGYLGSGKSTLLNHLLQLPEIKRQRPALIINEFGQEGIDGRLFADAGCPMFEINRGSLFCICTKADLIDALVTIDRADSTDVLLVEATGVAETSDFESLLQEPALGGRFRVKANLCVVDAINFTKVAPFLRAARYQACSADGLIVNKVDCVDQARLTQLKRVLAELNPRASQISAVHGQIDYQFILKLTHQRTEQALAIAQPESIHSASFRSGEPVERSEFLAAAGLLGDRLLRLKGQVLFSDRDVPEYVESIGGNITVKPIPKTIDRSVSPTLFTAIAFGFPDRQLERTFHGVLQRGT